MKTKSFILVFGLTTIIWISGRRAVNAGSPVTQASSQGTASVRDGTIRASGDDEYCDAHSEHLREVANASEKLDRDRALIAEFVGFVRREDANSVAAIESLFVGGTQEAAAQSLGMTEAQFNRTHNRLLQCSALLLRPDRGLK